jgi:hypothetical protein
MLIGVNYATSLDIEEALDIEGVTPALSLERTKHVGPYNNRETLRLHMGPKHVSLVFRHKTCKCLERGAMKNALPST